MPGWPGVLLGLALWAALPVVDAVAGWRNARQWRIQSTVLLRATQGRAATLALETPRGPGLFRAALVLPPSFADSPEVVAAQGGGDTATFDWEFTPTLRGEWRFDRLHHEVVSPLGFWLWRGHSPVDLTVRVFPDLRAENRALASLFLRRGLGGSHRVRQLGKGREFAHLRDYEKGDSYDEIDWKSTARHRRPVTRVFQIERTQDIHIVIDCSRRSARRLSRLESGSPFPQTQMDRFVRAALVLALSAIRQGDRPAVSLFRGGLDQHVRPGSGPPQFAAIRRAIYDAQADDSHPDFPLLFADLRRRMRHRSLVLFLSDLDDPLLADQFIEQLPHLTRRHVVVVAQMAAPSVRPLFHPDTPAADDAAVYSRLAGHLLWENACTTLARLRSLGAHVVHSPAEDLVADALSSYINIKRRQLL